MAGGNRKDTREGWVFDAAVRIPDIRAEFEGADEHWYEVTMRKDVPGLWAAVESRVRVRLGKASDGRLIAGALILGALRDPDLPVEVQARTLREVPLAQILSFVARAMASDPVAAEFFEVGQVPFDQPRLRPGPKGHPPEFFDSIARMYRAALEREPYAPVKAVRETINASRPKNQQITYTTVRRWIRRAVEGKPVQGGGDK